MQAFFNLLAVIGTFGTLMMGLAIYNDYQEVKDKQEKHKANRKSNKKMAKNTHTVVKK